MFVGYRGWLIRTINGEPTLVSPSHHKPWAPGENTAQCPECMLSMDENCSCGFYSLKEPAAELISYSSDIIGQVFLWGKVVDGERGFRSKKAMVSLLLIPPVKRMTEEELYNLSMRYNAPLVKAEGEILDAISHKRSEILQKAGFLPLIRSMKIREEIDHRRFPRRI